MKRQFNWQLLSITLLCSALAIGVGKVIQNKITPSPVTTAELIKQLKSPNLDDRRNAVTSFAYMGKVALPELIPVLEQSPIG